MSSIGWEYRKDPTMKQIIISLTDEEWKELLDSVRHEFGEPLSDDKVEEIVKKDVGNFIRETYIRDLGG